jgi:hypothetical protein
MKYLVISHPDHVISVYLWVGPDGQALREMVAH